MKKNNSKNIYLLFKCFVILMIFALVAGCFDPEAEQNNNEPILSSITVTKNPAKTTYNIGENLDTTGIVVEATYSDSSKKTVPIGDLTFNPVKLDTIGETIVITVTYTEKNISKNTTFNVNVNELPLLRIVTLDDLNITANKRYPVFGEDIFEITVEWKIPAVWNAASEIIISYRGIKETNYPKSLIVPIEIGDYEAVIDIAQTNYITAVLDFFVYN